MFVRVRSVIFSLIKEVRTIRSLSCKNPFCATVSGLRFSKASEEQIPTAIREETTKRVNCHKSDNLPLFCIEKDTRVGVLYAPFACVLMAERWGFEPQYGFGRNTISNRAHSTALPSLHGCGFRLGSLIFIAHNAAVCQTILRYLTL